MQNNFPSGLLLAAAAALFFIPSRTELQIAVGAVACVACEK